MRGQITPLCAPRFVRANKTDSLRDCSAQKSSTVAFALINFYVRAPQRRLQRWHYAQFSAALHEMQARSEEHVTRGVTFVIIMANHRDVMRNSPTKRE